MDKLCMNYYFVPKQDQPEGLGKPQLKRRKRNKSKQSFYLFYGGIGSFIAALLLFFIGIPIVLRIVINNQAQLKRGTPLWEVWENNPLPVYVKVMIFNITNPNAIQDGEKFKVEELGPYVFQEKRIKAIIEVNEEEDSVTYNETSYYYFRPELSNGTLDDRMTIPNIAFIATATVGHSKFSGLTSWPIQLLEMTGETFTRQKVAVRELLFEGMELNSLYSSYLQFTPGDTQNVLIGDRFGLLVGKNGSQTGPWKIRSGLKDSSTLGQIISWSGSKELDCWTDSSMPPYQQYCNQINGSDGTVNPPWLTRDRTIYAFNAGSCRSIYLRYVKDVEYNGIAGYQFGLPKELFASPDKNPDNSCFCHKVDGEPDRCVDGGYYLSACKHGAPAIMTKPHFLDADENLLSKIEGLNPNKEDHDSVVFYEPHTAAPMKVSVRLQASIELQPLPGISSFHNVPNVIIPIVWGELAVELNEEFSSLLIRYLTFPLKMIEVTKWAMINIAAIVALVGLTGIIRERRNCGIFPVDTMKSLPGTVGSLSNGEEIDMLDTGRE